MKAISCIPWRVFYDGTFHITTTFLQCRMINLFCGIRCEIQSLLLLSLSYFHIWKAPFNFSLFCDNGTSQCTYYLFMIKYVLTLMTKYMEYQVLHSIFLLDLVIEILIRNHSLYPIIEKYSHCHRRISQCNYLVEN